MVSTSAAITFPSFNWNGPVWQEKIPYQTDYSGSEGLYISDNNVDTIFLAIHIEKIKPSYSVEKAHGLMGRREYYQTAEVG